MTWLRQADSISGATNVARAVPKPESALLGRSKLPSATPALLVTKDSRDPEAQLCFCCQLGPRGASTTRNILAKNEPKARVPAPQPLPRRSVAEEVGKLRD